MYISSRNPNGATLGSGARFKIMKRTNIKPTSTSIIFLLPSSPSRLLLLAAVIFAAFASSTSSFVHALSALEAENSLPSFEEHQLSSVSSSDSVTLVGGRRLVASCPTFLYADHDDLAASNGWNLLSVSCTLGTQINVNGAGKRMKIKKDPSAEGVVEVDRQATSENKGRHFNVQNGAVLEVEGLTLTGGYEYVRFLFFFCSSSSE